MINIGKILKRAWHILWNYRVLWIFGILLAITAGGRQWRWQRWQREQRLPDQRQQWLPGRHPRARTQPCSELYHWFTQNIAAAVRPS